MFAKPRNERCQRMVLRYGWAVLVLIGGILIASALPIWAAWSDATVLVSHDVIPDLDEAGLDAVIADLVEARGGQIDARTMLNVVNDRLRDGLGRPEISMAVLEVYVTERIAAGALPMLLPPAPTEKRAPAPEVPEEADSGWSVKPVEGATWYAWVLTATDKDGKVVLRTKLHTDGPKLSADDAAAVFDTADADGAVERTVAVAVVTVDGVGWFSKRAGTDTAIGAIAVPAPAPGNVEPVEEPIVEPIQ